MGKECWMATIWIDPFGYFMLLDELGKRADYPNYCFIHFIVGFHGDFLEVAEKAKEIVDKLNRATSVEAAEMISKLKIIHKS